MSQLVSRIATRKIDEDHLLDNPFPGLRPFNIEESHLFFGREGQTDEVLMKLSENRFVSVIGPSGSGKSSFVYCGVLPILYGGFLAHKGPDWSVIVTRPGASPIDNLADALLEKDEEFLQASDDDKKIRKTITTSLLKSSSLGLVEAIKQLSESSEKNYLILVDQFEELFRFRKVDETGGNINESLAFVNLLMEAVQNVTASIYVTTTMRSDFIGDCAEYPELTKKINDSHYLIPQMTRDQKRMAIIGPVAVGGGQITPRLVQQLLNDLGEKSDQLPILQHALMRTWAHWRDNREGQEPIDIHHYEAIGTMAEALSRHANEAYEELEEEQQKICEIMFKALTEKRGEGDGIRRPTKLQEVADLANVPAEKVITVVEKFREPGRSLLTPPAHIKLSAESYLDISHESLMRIWERLKIWADEEGESARLYLRLADASAMFQVGKAGLWRPPDLQLALNWQQKYNPTLTWAQRYHPAFERTMVFLEYSKKEWETEQRQKELQQKRALKRARVTAMFMGGATIVSIAFLIFAFSQKVRADREAEVAVQQKQLAEENAEQARLNAEEANRQKGIADERRVEAEEARDEADMQRMAAVEARNEAIEARDLAEQRRVEAEEARNLAEERRQEAEAAREAEAEQRRAAVAARDRAERLRRVAIAKQMAIKSIQEPDVERQALLAQQAYIFNMKNDGFQYDYDVYNGLYYANKALSQRNDESFNELVGHTGEVKAISASFTDENTIYSAGADGNLFKWNISQATSEPQLIYHNERGHNTMDLNPEDRVLAMGGEYNYFHIFDLDNLNDIPEAISFPENKIRYMLYSSDYKKLVLVGQTGGLYAWDGEDIKPIESGQQRISAIASNPVANQIALGYANGDIAFIDLDNKGKNIFYSNPDNEVYAITYSLDGKQLAVGEESGIIKLWDVNNSSRPVFTLPGHTGIIRDLGFSHDGSQLASAGFDKSVRIWHLNNLSEQPIVLSDHTDKLWSIEFTKDDELLLAGCTDNMLRKWPTRIEPMADEICQEVSRNLTKEEWNLYVAEDIDYQKTCPRVK